MKNKKYVGEIIDIELTDEIEDLIYSTIKRYHDKKYEDLIYSLVQKYHDEKYEEMDSIYRMAKSLAENIYINNKRISDRLDEIERLIQSHAIGVQNVYNEFVKFIKIKNIYTDLMDTINKTEEL
jgi:hypothetical protein